MADQAPSALWFLQGNRQNRHQLDSLDYCDNPHVTSVQQCEHTAALLLKDRLLEVAQGSAHSWPKPSVLEPASFSQTPLNRTKIQSFKTTTRPEVPLLEQPFVYPSSSAKTVCDLFLKPSLSLTSPCRWVQGTLFHTGATSILEWQKSRFLKFWSFQIKNEHQPNRTVSCGADSAFGRWRVSRGHRPELRCF